MSTWVFSGQERFEKSVSLMIFDMAQRIETSCVLHNSVFNALVQMSFVFGRQEALW